MISETELHLGQTELFTVEKVLRNLYRGKSTLIHSPYPSNSVPLLVGLSFVYAPNQPRRSLLCFPKSGYVTDFDCFHYTHTVVNEGKPTGTLIERQSLKKLSDFDGRPILYTVNVNGSVNYNIDAAPARPDALFLDMRKKGWRDDFAEIEEVLDYLSDVPLIAYTDSITDYTAAEMTEELVDETVSLTNDVLASAPVTEIPSNASALTKLEGILTQTTPEYNYIFAGDDMNGLIPQILSIRNRIRSRRGMPLTPVGAVFNRLMKTPACPSYWNAAVREIPTGGNLKPIPKLFEIIENAADQYKDTRSDLLYEYVRLCRKLYDRLDDSDANPLQRAGLSMLNQARKNGIDTTFVFKNSVMRRAFEMGAEEEFQMELLGNIRFVDSLEDVDIYPNQQVIFMYPPYKTDYAYQFPHGQLVTFLFHSVWEKHVIRAGAAATELTNVTHHESKAYDEATIIEDASLDLAEIDREIDDQLRQLELGGEKARAASDGGSDTRSASKDSHIVYRFALKSDKTEELFAKEFPETVRLTVYDPEEAAVVRTSAKNVKKDDRILLIDNETRTDIYDVLLENNRNRKTIREAHKWIKNWRFALDDIIETHDETGALKAIQNRGSNITSTRTLRLWSTGKVIGPQDDWDVRRVIEVARPGFEGPRLDDYFTDVVKAIKRIRLNHQRIGKNVRRAIEADFDVGAATRYGKNINKKMVKDIIDEVEPVTVLGVRRCDN